MFNLILHSRNPSIANNVQKLIKSEPYFCETHFRFDLDHSNKIDLEVLRNTFKKILM